MGSGRPGGWWWLFLRWHRRCWVQSCISAVLVGRPGTSLIDTESNGDLAAEVPASGLPVTRLLGLVGDDWPPNSA